MDSDHWQVAHVLVGDPKSIYIWTSLIGLNGYLKKDKVKLERRYIGSGLEFEEGSGVNMTKCVVYTYEVFKD